MFEEMSDQRGIRRFSMKLPVTVQPKGGDAIEAVTKDVSARGVFIFLDSELSEDSPLEFTLTLPPEITMTRSVRVHCSGKVVRIAREGEGPIGIAAQIDSYKFVPDPVKSDGSES
jgi:hypothetical protein